MSAPTILSSSYGTYQGSGPTVNINVPQSNLLLLINVVIRNKSGIASSGTLTLTKIRGDGAYIGGGSVENEIATFYCANPSTGNQSVYFYIPNWSGTWYWVYSVLFIKDADLRNPINGSAFNTSQTQVNSLTTNIETTSGNCLILDFRNTESSGWMPDDLQTSILSTDWYIGGGDYYWNYGVSKKEVFPGGTHFMKWTRSSNDYFYHHQLVAIKSTIKNKKASILL